MDNVGKYIIQYDFEEALEQLGIITGKLDIQI